MTEETKEERCLLEEARKQAIKDHGERGKSMPLYISCPCPRCKPRWWANMLLILNDKVFKYQCALIINERENL